MAGDEYSSEDDFSLSQNLTSNNAYTPEDDFSLQNDLSSQGLVLSEGIGVNDTRDQFQQLFRAFTEQLVSADNVDLLRLKFVSLQEQTLFSDTVSKSLLKNLSEDITLQEVYNDNAGFILGTVQLEGSPQANATVYIVASGSGSFKGADITDSNGDYSVGRVTDDNRYLVAVDYSDGGTNYGDEESIEVTFN